MTYQEFMPHWKKQDKCFEDEKIEMVDKLYGNKIMNEVSDREVQKIIAGLKTIEGFNFTIDSQFFISQLEVD